MRRLVTTFLGFLLAIPAALAAQQPQQPPQQDVVEAARKAREAKKNLPKAKFVFTNDNIPTTGSPISVVGTSPAPAEPASKEAAAEAKKEATADEDKKKEEAEWRKKFAEARAKLSAAEKELDLLQRELNLNRQQYYSDPNKTLREEYTRSEVNKGKADIDAKKSEVERLRNALAALEDELRRAGGPAAWGRP
ncbi:MAG: hypothetical protein M1453_09770 [Acidobacteria bacterium]|nr:hypothetical protein [Acidobacteriota bacterium]MCL5288264.1 hypothetical protein [Acidobacteriota bacterium]